MDSLCIIQISAAAPEAAGQLADAARDDGKKLQRALVSGGATKAAAALLLALTRPPRGGSALLCAYYGVLAAVAIFGALEVAVGFWVAGDPDRRRRWGRRVIWASVALWSRWSSSPHSVVSPCSSEVAAAVEVE